MSQYTVVGFLDLWNVHSVFEHVDAMTIEQAVNTTRRRLRDQNPEYNEGLHEGFDAFTVLGVFDGHVEQATTLQLYGPSVEQKGDGPISTEC